MKFFGVAATLALGLSANSATAETYSFFIEGVIPAGLETSDLTGAEFELVLSGDLDAPPIDQRTFPTNTTSEFANTQKISITNRPNGMPDVQLSEDDGIVFENFPTIPTNPDNQDRAFVQSGF
ncbi:MAG: hypothetical protein ACFBSD_15625 [Paracoccaceae bacterium]